MTHLEPESRERVKQIFREAVESPPEVVEGVLDFACRDCPGLRGEIEELLAAYRRTAPWLGSPVPAGMVQEALEEALLPVTPPQVGRYHIRRLIAAGGMGSVYEAEQESPRRTVAVKVLRRELASPSSLRRFELEAELLARLQHPSIAQVFEAGLHDDGAGPVPYLVLEYVEGARPITSHVVERKLGAQSRLELFASLCDAVQHGHQQGIIHRDLKPSNVLVDAGGRLKVIDFGIATSTNPGGSPGTMHTQVGQLLGTLQYMSPEQCEADPRAVDVRSDVYSLGLLLHEILGERVPYDISGLPLHEATRIIRMQAPQMLGAIDARWRGDVETIVAKALEKDRERRYRSAAELADDVRRHLAGDAILARPASLAYRLQVFARRNKAVVGGVLGVFVMLVLGTVGTVLGLLQANSARQQAEGSLFDLVTAQGLKATELGNPAQGHLWFANAADYASGDRDRQRANRVRLETWKRHVATPLNAFRTRGSCQDLAFHPAGTHLLAVNGMEKCSIWNLGTGKKESLPGGERPVRSAAWSPCGRRVALAMPGGRLEVLGFPEGGLLHGSSHPGEINALTFSPGGLHLAIGSNSVRIWDPSTGELLEAAQPHPGPVVALSFNQRGDRLLTVSNDETARVFSVNPRASAAALFSPARNLRDYLGRVFRPTFLRGGTAIATLNRPSVIQVLDAESGNPLQSLEHDDPGGSFNGIASSPDDRWILTWGANGAQLWDANSLRRRGPALDHRSVIVHAAFSPDGLQILTGAIEDHATLWSLPAGRAISSVRLQDAAVRVAFSTRKGIFSTFEQAGKLVVWQHAAGHPLDYQVALGQDNSYAAVSRDERQWMFVGSILESRGKETQVRDTRTGETVGVSLAAETPLRGGCFLPDGAWVVTLASSWLFCRDWRDGKSRFAPIPLPSPPVACAAGNDGRWIGALCEKGELLIVNANTGTVRFRLEHGAAVGDPIFGFPSGVRFTSGSTGLVSWGGSRINIWDMETGARRFHVEHWVRTVDLSPDDRFLVSAGMATSREAAVWSLGTGQDAPQHLQHPDGVPCAAFSPDGQSLLTACDDGFARLWDWKNGRLRAPPFDHGARVAAVAFSNDGRWAITSTHSPTLHIWDVRSGQEVSPARRLLGTTPQLLVTPDTVIAAGPGGASVYSLADLTPPGNGPSLTQQRVLAELLAGQRIEGTGIHNLTAREWLARFEALHEPPGATGPGGEAPAR